MAMNPRLRRLQRDHEQLLELSARSEVISIQGTEGNPPEKYVLHLMCRGIREIGLDGQPLYTESHMLGLLLHEEYPRKGPLLQMLTPVFHPNIAQNGLICYGEEGGHGWAPAMPLGDVIVRVVQMIRYENVGMTSVFNPFATAWAEQHRDLFPLDTRPIVGADPPEIKIVDELQLDDIRIVHQDSVDQERWADDDIF